MSSRNSASLVELAMDLLARADTPYDSVAIETGPVPTVVTFQARMFDVRRADGKQSTFAHDDARTAVREIAAPASDADPPSDS